MIVVYVNMGLDKDFYTNIQKSPNLNTNTVITNKYYSLESDYEPANLKSIDDNYSSGNRKMVEEAANAFNEMAAAAKRDGFIVRAVSTYRSYIYQRDLYNRYVAKDGVENADTYSARPGHSEHQTGLAVDVDNSKDAYTSFGNTKEFNWMKENAYKYGYILRYTKENEWITGYKDEPWHYRYVGKEIANYINEHPMTFEEYYVRFLDK
jgi:LAS superfamily LD-carboxypeptidase LdcB